jgi:DnaK suppressor protein
MTPTELARLRGVLEARQAGMEDLLRNHEGMEVDSSAGILDQFQYASACEMTLANLERESVGLRDVRAALRRTHLGTFGICLNCEEEISLKRLAAVPWRPLCLVCREAADLGPMLPNDTVVPKP